MQNITLVKGDITLQVVDVIVNAANNSLLGGGGVDGAIHKAAGKDLLAECYTLGGCETGKAKITNGYKLPSPFIIHTVGPMWNGGKRHEAELLAMCYKSCFEIFKAHNLKSIAFPSISTGIYSYPLKDAINIALTEMRSFLTENETASIIVVAFDDATYNEYQKQLNNEKSNFWIY